MSRKISAFTSESHALNFTGDLSISVKENPSPFDRNTGFTMSVVSMTRDAPHGGEMHPDGDESIHVISGCLEVTLEFEQEQVLRVGAGEGIVIPKGIWHKVHVVEPAKIVTVSAGPGFEYRELQ